MDDVYVITGVNGRSARDEPSPRNYHIEGGHLARRITMLKDNEVIFYMDYFITNQTRYVLFLEVTRKYRGTAWLDYVKDIQLDKVSQDHPTFNFLQPNTVWLYVREDLVARFDDVFEARTEVLNKEPKYVDSTIYVSGAESSVYVQDKDGVTKL